MILELEDGTTIERPTDDQLREALSTLQGNADIAFAILSLNDETYLQVAPVEDGYLLEFQDGDIKRHYQATVLVTLTTVIQAFQAYNHGQQEWMSAIQWQHLDL